MELWTGFLLGILGGFHCVGMCGPIVIALPRGSGGGWGYLLSRIIYNAGRILTYTLLGLITGLIGGAVAFAGYQNALSIAIGVLILLAVIIPGRLKGRLISSAKIGVFTHKIMRYWGSLFGIDTNRSLFVIGILNGFLPCGLVYLALAGAISTGGPLSGATYMAAFGFGTVPVMLAVAVAGNLIGLKFRRAIVRLIPVGALILAALFILRGLSLGIPYVSPRVVNTGGKQTMECCSPAESEQKSK